MSDSVGAALTQARALGLHRLDAQLLLGRQLQQTRAWLIAHEDAALSAEQQQAFLALCRRRADGEPLAYLLGEREFHGLMLQVGPEVLVPRPDTETLVDWALQLLATPLACAPEVADLGTGSGAIALALKHRHPTARVCAVEVSAPALGLARANGTHHRLQIEWHLGDWWQPLAGRRFHLVASNPPYVAGDDPHLAALRHEPAPALTPGGDGLSALAHIVRGAPAHLHDGGWLLLEHGHEQANAVCRLLADAGFTAVQTRADLAGRPRCSGGRWTALR
ncbi:MAG: hemK protein [Proteobacteria bacterium]|nr:hemK protein [Pseudomonadota bacterium]